MYVTKRLSHLLKFPDAVSDKPEGPNSGYLVIQDEESETYFCFGLCKNQFLEEMPFPLNKELTVRYTSNTGQYTHVSDNPVFLIPVLNQPLFSNRYYAINPHGKHKGEAFTCSTEEDKCTFCFCRCPSDAKPRPLDPNNIYQQFLIVPYESRCTPRGYFTAKSSAKDGFPPLFFKQMGWTIYTKTPKHFKLEQAQGRDYTHCSRLPPLTSHLSEPVVVGKWYWPFMFVKDGRLKDQMERSMYYEMTLQQSWEQIFSCKRDIDYNRGNSVIVDVVIQKEDAFVDGMKAMNKKYVVDEVIWFKSPSNEEGKTGFGLRVEIFERMKWEQERAGWLGGDERELKIKRTEEFKEGGEWKEFGCYVLVERFNLRRMDGSLAMAYDFKHYHQIGAKWE